MISGPARAHSGVTPSHEIFRGTPGYDPLDASNATPPFPPLQLLLSVRQEARRGGRIDIAEFVTPARDVPLHFWRPICIEEGVRHGIADILATISLAATLTYHDPIEYQESGIYYQPPAREGRQRHQLEAGELLVGWPDVYPEPERLIRHMNDFTDGRSSDTHRVVANTDELGEVIGRFGSVLSLGEADQGKLTHAILSHVETTRSFRRMHGLVETIASASDPQT